MDESLHLADVDLSGYDNLCDKLSPGTDRGGVLHIQPSYIEILHIHQ